MSSSQGALELVFSFHGHDEVVPGFFTLHALRFMLEEKSDGKRRMQQILKHIFDGLCAVLMRYAKIRPDAFTEQFTDILLGVSLVLLLVQIRRSVVTK